MTLTSFKTYLIEALIDVDAKDIDKIYAPLRMPIKALADVWKTHHAEFVKASTESDYDKHRKAKLISQDFMEVFKQHGGGSNRPIKTIDSANLKSETAQKAHAINPIKIHVWLMTPNGLGNCYIPSRHEIHIGIEAELFKTMLLNLSNVPNHRLTMLKNEVGDKKLKATIRHELTHWIDDSLHNMYLTKALGQVMTHRRAGDEKKAKQAYTRAAAHGEADIYLSPTEITPMVNQIAEYKRRIGEKKYDKLTWVELCELVPSLGSLNLLYGAYWRKKMFERLARENLIGKNFLKKLSL